jgi:hypothetical protein
MARSLINYVTRFRLSCLALGSSCLNLPSAYASQRPTKGRCEDWTSAIRDLTAVLSQSLNCPTISACSLIDDLRYFSLSYMFAYNCEVCVADLYFAVSYIPVQHEDVAFCCFATFGCCFSVCPKVSMCKYSLS